MDTCYGPKMSNGRPRRVQIGTPKIKKQGRGQTIPRAGRGKPHGHTRGRVAGQCVTLDEGWFLPNFEQRFCRHFGTILHGSKALEVSFPTNKESLQLEFIKAPKSVIYANLSSFCSKLPNLNF